MLWNASKTRGCAIAATDGSIGTISDFLFDDASWRIRWLIVDTGGWLSGRKVLLPPSVMGHLDADDHEFSVKLTRQQVKDSPDVDTERPVSRQMESGVYDYYGWNPYWSTGLYMGAYANMGEPVPTALDREAAEGITDAKDDPRLRSIEAVTGYHIHARDGEIGHVEDFLVEDADWSIHYLVVDTKNWWPGERVLISPRSVRDIDWSNKLVNIGVDRDTVKDSPTYGPSVEVDRAYEQHFHRYYEGVDAGAGGRL
jgi:hypothetical protein